MNVSLQVQEQKMKLATCRKEHGTADMVELRRKIKWSVETNLSFRFKQIPKHIFKKS